jgi:hypothetical protein
MVNFDHRHNSFFKLKVQASESFLRIDYWNQGCYKVQWAPPVGSSAFRRRNRPIVLTRESCPTRGRLKAELQTAMSLVPGRNY